MFRFFAVLAVTGLYWTGSGWSPVAAQALPFVGSANPYERALAVSNKLRGEGNVCNVAYLQLTQPDSCAAAVAFRVAA